MNFIRTRDKQYPIFLWQILEMFKHMSPEEILNSSYHDGLNNGEYLPVYMTDVPPDEDGGTWVENTPVFNATTNRWESTWMLKMDSAEIAQEKLDTLKAQKKQLLAEKRYQIETSGIDVNGFSIKTDRESQSQITCAVFAIERGYITKVDWKGENGWIDMDVSVIASLPPLVSNHVQLCFQTERQISNMIDACTSIEELSHIDIELGWPTGIYELADNLV